MINNQTENIDLVSWEVESSRQRVNLALSERSIVLGIAGPCSFELKDIVTMDSEAAALKALPVIQPGLAVIHRQPIWKPRSDPNAWSGLESTDPELAFEFIRALSNRYAISSMEFGSQEQVGKYSSLLSFAWIGARSRGNTELILKAATHDPDLPLGIKNGLDGDLDRTLNQIEMLRRERGQDAAEIALIYRGGENAMTPDEWERRYVEAFDATDGKVIVDSAHGSEMAHHHNGEYTKTSLGQIVCLKHTGDLTNGGIIPAGLMVEASSIVGVTDPNIPFKIGSVVLREMAKRAVNK